MPRTYRPSYTLSQAEWNHQPPAEPMPHLIGIELPPARFLMGWPPGSEYRPSRPDAHPLFG